MIPKWVASMLRSETVFINGDGETSRDFCYIENVIQANLLSGTVDNPEAAGQVYNVAVGDTTTLNQLHVTLNNLLAERVQGYVPQPPTYRDFRAGDMRYSLADISKARKLLGYIPIFRAPEGLERAIDWYVAQLAPQATVRRKAAEEEVLASR